MFDALTAEMIERSELPSLDDSFFARAKWRMLEGQAQVAVPMDAESLDRGKHLDESKSSISQAQSYRAIGEFWDTHDVIDYWEATKPVEFEIDIQSETRTTLCL